MMVEPDLEPTTGGEDSTGPEWVILTAGGTIDKVYFDLPGDYAVGTSLVEQMLVRARVTQPVEIREIMRKDSLEMTDADRQALRSAVAELSVERVVITHGTDTMPLTAAALEGLPGKIIVLTGAFAPARFADSDAPFNLGMAVAAVQTLPPGVYIAMNGMVVRGASVRKDRTLMRFVPVQSGAPGAARSPT
jgi:L-asparaginase